MNEPMPAPRHRSRWRGVPDRSFRWFAYYTFSADGQILAEVVATTAEPGMWMESSRERRHYIRS
jgi:hypothetical protein